MANFIQLRRLNIFAFCHLTEREREKTSDIEKITRKVEIPKHNKVAARAARRAQKIAKQQEGNVESIKRTNIIFFKITLLEKCIFKPKLLRQLSS